MTTFERLQQIIRENCLAPSDVAISEASSFIDDLRFDSLDRIELLMRVEDEFRIEIRDADAELCLTVNDAVRLIDREAKQ